jgi:hypothetical protein
MKNESIKACPRCGSVRLRALSLREGGIPGISEVSGLFYCNDCGKHVVPVIFRDMGEYRKFLKGLGGKTHI